MKEIWKPILGFSRYEISSFGRVKAKARYYKDSWGRTYNSKERILSTKTRYRKSRIDYSKVKLVNDDGAVKNIFVHRLVAETFIPNPNNLSEVNHIDLDKSNNRVTNLEWVTKIENMERCVQKPHPGETNGNHKLTSEIVSMCRHERDNGKTYAELSRYIKDVYDISISSTQIRNVVINQWQHI